MGTDVFISFSSADQDFAERIYDRLKKSGVQPWMSSRDITPGTDYQGSIVRAIQASKVVLLVFSSKAAHSVEVVKGLSLSSNKLVIPARIEDVMPEGAFLYQMSNRQFYDLFDDFDRRLDDLCAYVKATVSSETLTPPSMPGRAGPAPRRAKTKASMAPWVIAGLFGLFALGALGWIKLGPGQSAADATAPAAGALEQVVVPADSAPPVLNPPANSAANLVAAAPMDSDSESVSTEPSEAAKTYAAMLAPGGFDRKISISEFAGADAFGLSAADAALLLENTNNRRADTLEIIAPKLAGGLRGPGAALVLGPLSGFSRKLGIANLIDEGKLADRLSSRDAVTILQGTGNRRADSLQKIVPRLLVLDAQGITAVLGDLRGFDRKRGIQYLADGGKIAQGISQADVPAILGNIGNNRADTLQILSPYLR